MTPVRLQAHRTVPYWLVAVSGIKVNTPSTLLKLKKKKTKTPLSKNNNKKHSKHYNGAATNGLLAAVL